MQYTHMTEEYAVMTNDVLRTFESHQKMFRI